MIKDIKLRWVCYAPGVVLIGDTDTELRKFKLRFLLGIGSNISTYKCDAIKYLEKLF